MNGEEIAQASLELEAVLNHYDIPIESSKFKIVCPFHGDINASLLVDLSKGSWYCFGCQEKGRALEFIKLAEKFERDLDALILLNRIIRSNGAKSKLRYEKPKTKRQLAREKRKLLTNSEDYYYNLPPVDWTTTDNEYTRNEKQYLINRGFELDTLNKVGCKVTYSNDYPVIFPMRDMGEFRGYVCRTMDSEVEAKRKYLYNRGFSRRDTLVGKYDCKTVMIVEGYMDYLKAKQLGVKYVCAILGWKITAEQIAKLKAQGVKTIISALDNDKCGRKGTRELKKHFEVVRFKFPKNTKDIGEMDKRTFEKSKNNTMRERRKKNGFIKQHEKPD